jgi:hypothetical protein
LNLSAAPTIGAIGNINLASGINLTIAGSAYTVINSLGAAGSATATDLQGINGGLALNYALGSNIDATATSGWNVTAGVAAGFAPIGNSTTQFTGKFDGLGHTISNLTINTPAATNVGLFGYAGTGSAVKNVGLVGGSVNGASFVGELVGHNGGTVSNSYSTGNVSGTGNWVGGLAGWNYLGSVANSYATGNVSGVNNVGGLIGHNDGPVSNSYATGNVSGTGNWAGGLVGVNGFNSTLAAITNSYSTGNVSGGAIVGGLVGWNYNFGTVTNAYSTGFVSGTTNIGGLIGSNAGAVATSYWNTTTSGKAYGLGIGLNGTVAGIAGTAQTGVTDLTTAQMQQQSNFTGFDFANTWVGYNGYTNPLLRSFMTALTVTASNTTKAYDGLAILASGVTYSSAPNANLLGTLNYGGTKNVGSYAPSGLYSNQQGYIISYVNGTLTVNPVALTVTANAASKTYDGLAYTGGSGVAYSGFVNSETSAVLGGALAYSGTSQGAINAGSYLITPGGYTSGNYAIRYIDGALTVNAATLTVNPATSLPAAIQQMVLTTTTIATPPASHPSGSAAIVSSTVTGGTGTTGTGGSTTLGTSGSSGATIGGTPGTFGGSAPTPVTTVTTASATSNGTTGSTPNEAQSVNSLMGGGQPDSVNSNASFGDSGIGSSGDQSKSKTDNMGKQNAKPEKC